MDATLIRCLLVPALISLLGAWNGWLPGWAARLLRVAPSPLGGGDSAGTCGRAGSQRRLDPVQAK